MDRVGLGFAGLGWLGESLIKELSAFPELHLAAVQDPAGDLAADVAARYSSPWHGTEYENLLTAPNVDAIVICSPNFLHVPQARAALQAGKHVLVQKPLALSPADARATIDLAADAGRLLFVDYSYRYLDTVRALREALPAIGRVRRLTGTFHNIYGPGKAWFFDPALSGGGALIDLGIHLLDLALELLGPAAVHLESADLSFAQRHPVEDTARLLLRLDEAPFDLVVSWNAALPMTEITFEIVGERGRLRWENVDGSFFHFRALHNGACLLDRETTLRADTLRAFVQALEMGTAPPVHTRVYELLAETYGRSAAPRQEAADPQ